jgi:uncharacterized membrane protein YphA (DoxX/SURF4 family)
MNVAFLIIRLIIGLGIASHGAQKLLGWLGTTASPGPADS